jgi:hypothetical protein
MKPLSFFIKNIGKRIYRDANGCPCETCKEITENGLIVYDKDHADYLYIVQVDYHEEGIELNYRTKK